MVLSFSVLIVSVQVASATLSPTAVARPFRSNVLRWSIGLLVFTFVYGTYILARLEDRVLQLPVFLTVLLSVASIGVFLFVVERVTTELRPCTVVAAVAREGHIAVRNVYPAPWTGVSGIKPASAALKQSAGRAISHTGRAGVVIGFDLEGLVSLAEGYDCLIELVPQVGDRIDSGTPLFRVHCGGNYLPDRHLCNSVALGAERILKQDPAFALRVIVDIAAKALSPAINDPATSALAIDQIQLLLLEIGKRDLSAGLIRDRGGKARLVFRKPDWQDYIQLTVEELRHYGRNSTTVVRRLRAMIGHLIATLPPERAPLLQEQLDLLEAPSEPEFRYSNARAAERTRVPRTSLKAEQRLMPF
jgi:uncharacterized membrane protein